MKQVIVFHMTGCGPCEEYLPRFRAAIKPYKGRIDARAVNLARNDAGFQDAATKFKITATPTTLVLDERDKVLRRKVGGLEDRDITTLLEFAAK
jgi:thiol-disulfide isomerase/thioredoxin